MSYDATSGTSLGNITRKSDVGNYTYQTDKINALSSITNASNTTNPPGVISQNEQDITYTSFLKVAGVSENGTVLSYTYGANEQRLLSTTKVSFGPDPINNFSEQKYYLGAFERRIAVSTTQDIHYISAGNGLCAIIVKSGGTITPYFVYTDHLGSILSVTDASANVVAQQNFDAWGRNRNPADWTYSNVPAVPGWLYRGFTGHEMLSQFALINMNGRVYDPANGRMISPDDNVQQPFCTQSFNRYTYAFNIHLNILIPLAKHFIHGQNFGQPFLHYGMLVEELGQIIQIIPAIRKIFRLEVGLVFTTNIRDYTIQYIFPILAHKKKQTKFLQVMTLSGSKQIHLFS